MLDDIHLLTSKQREWLLICSSIPAYIVSIWLAERLEALTVDQLLSPGSPQGRDYSEVVTIEGYWRGHVSKFERMVSSVADRRTRDARDVEIGRFADCFQNTLDAPSGMRPTSLESKWWRRGLRKGPPGIPSSPRGYRAVKSLPGRPVNGFWVGELWKFSSSVSCVRRSRPWTSSNSILQSWRRRIHRMSALQRSYSSRESLSCHTTMDYRDWHVWHRPT